MRGAFGKPQGTVARVRIGQPLMSVRARDQHKAEVIEALRRAKFKFPGRQKVWPFFIWTTKGCSIIKSPVFEDPPPPPGFFPEGGDLALTGIV